MNRKSWIAILVFVAVSQAAGIAGSFVTVAAIPTWYAGLVKSHWNPPAWVFGPAWLVLYTMMGAAAGLVWERGFSNREVRNAILLFMTQLVLNTFWSVIFFGFRSPGLALAEIVVLWATLTVTMAAFFRVRRLAGLLWVPYWAWCSFAVYLNYAIVRLN
ncbi:MAG: TspO/MBR family protein [Candidatus Omnitrophota bacterium]|jgi:tryptophan-rich sensory protein